MCWVVLDSNRRVVHDDQDGWIATFKSPEVALNVVVTHNASASQNVNTTVLNEPSKDGCWSTKVSW